MAAALAACALLLSSVRSWLTGWLSAKTVDQLYATLHEALWLVIIGVVIEEWKLLKQFAKFARYSVTGRFREAFFKAWQHRGEIIEGAGFSILVIGLAGELAIAPLIETSQKAELQTQKKQTADALAQAGKLGVDVNNLHTFVDNREAALKAQVDNFTDFATDEKKHADDVIAELNANREKLDISRKQAVDAANEAKKALATIAEANAQREFSQSQHDKFVSLVRGLPRIPTASVSFDSVVGSREAKRYGGFLSNALADALRRHIDGPPGLSSCVECTGVLICVNGNATPETSEDAKSIRRAYELSGVKGAKFCSDPNNGLDSPTTVKVIIGLKQ